MANLLTTTDIASATGALGDHFDTFSRNITVFKQPQVVLNNPAAARFPGYGNLDPNIQSYNSQSQTFPAIIRFVGEQNSDMIAEIKTTSPGTALCRIKVKEDAKNYIENGKTEYILVDGIRCNMYSEVASRNFLGMRFYEYWLTQSS